MDYNNELDKWSANYHNLPRERQNILLASWLAATLAEAGEGGKAYRLNKDRPEGACWDVITPGAANVFIIRYACFIISLLWSKRL
jgi:hypothetical protein